MYTELSLCFLTLSLATIVGNCAPVTHAPVIRLSYLNAIKEDISKLQQILPNNGATLNMPSRTGRPCARSTIEHFKKELDVLVQENVGKDNILTTIRNIQENIDAAWRPCARSTIEHFKKELDVLVQENVGKDNILTTIRNIQENIDAAWKGIEEEGNEEQESQDLSLEDAFKKINTFLQQCYSNNSTSCDN